MKRIIWEDQTEVREGWNCRDAETGEQEHVPSESVMVYAADFDAHTQAVGEFLGEMYAVMIDPLADGTMKVPEICAALLRAAREQRDQAAERCSCHECIHSRRMSALYQREKAKLEAMLPLSRDIDRFYWHPRRDPATRAWRWGRVTERHESFVSAYGFISWPHLESRLTSILRRTSK